MLRLNKIDHNAPSASPAEFAKALWSAVFPYFAHGRDAPKNLLAELILPSAELHAALMSLGELVVTSSPSTTS